MSIKQISLVWDNSKSKGATRLTLLALADIAKPSGYCWPSFAYIAKMTNMSRRQAIRHVQALEELGELIVLRDGDHASNDYVLWLWDGNPDLRRCESCGRYEIPELDGFHEHHKKPKGEGGSDAPSNLATLCEQCHKAQHSDKMTPATIPAGGLGYDGGVYGTSAIAATPPSAMDGTPLVPQMALEPVKEPPKDKPPIKSAGKNEIRSFAEQAFKDQTALMPPAKKSEAGELWWQPLREMCDLALWEQERIARFMAGAIGKMRKDQLTISSPKSIIKTYRALIAEAKVKAGDQQPSTEDRQAKARERIAKLRKQKEQG